MMMIEGDDEGAIVALVKYVICVLVNGDDGTIGCIMWLCKLQNTLDNTS